MQGSGSGSAPTSRHSGSSVDIAGIKLLSLQYTLCESVGKSGCIGEIDVLACSGG